MNERIKELLDQCQIETYGVNGELLEIGFDAEKFAELIVRECIDIVAAGGEFASRPKLVENLQEHFGVEE
jgi:2,4-dienoyl-CoA reductase-like NADH-dependent reductase (Old Yellow Enzyme family)